MKFTLNEWNAISEAVEAEKKKSKLILDKMDKSEEMKNSEEREEVRKLYCTLNGISQKLNFEEV